MTRTVTVGDVTFGAPMPFVDVNGCEWVLSSIGGWDNSGAGVRRTDLARQDGHGSFSIRGWRTGRSLAVSGAVLCPTRASAASVVQRLNSLLADGREQEMRVEDADLPSLSASVGLADMPVVDWSTPGGTVVNYAFELWAPDPLRYGDPVSQSTGFPVLRGGLEYDLYTDGVVDTGFLEYGEASATGRLVLSNVGTADVWPVFQVDGQVDSAGFEIAVVGTDQRIRFSGPVAPGSVLVIDSAAGSAVIDGDADRGGQLTFRDWFTVPAGGSVEIAFIPLGTDRGGQLTAVTRPGFW